MNQSVAQPLPAIDPALLPDETQISLYEQRGWHITDRLFSDEQLEQMRQAIDAHHAGHRDHALPRSARFSDWQASDGQGVRNNEFCSLQNDAVRSLAWHPQLGAIAARLARASEIRLFDDQAVCKPPASEQDSSAVGWHTDHSYWSTCTSDRMLTAWIPLQDTNEVNGTLHVVNGSHLWPESEHLRGFNDADLSGLARRLGREVADADVIPLNLQRGQVSFHHMRAIHGSTNNRSQSGRYALAVHLQDGDNRHRVFNDNAGNPVVLPHDRLCRVTADGAPDYSDPAVFPVIWPIDNG